MTPTLQHTIATPVRAEGVALHSGATTRIEIRPAEEGTGVRFRRVDLGGPPESREIQAIAANMVDARLGVRIRNKDGATAMTVEHLLSAFTLADIDNAVVEIDREELPIFDGSVGAFVDLVVGAGRRALTAPRRRLKVIAPIEVADGDRYVSISPDDRRRCEIEIAFRDSAIGRRRLAFDLDDAAMRKRIVSARTFCSFSEIEEMRRQGFALGGSLDNAIVVDGARILNEGALRDPDEFALHKAADLVGDLALVGAPVFGFVKAYKPGHDLNARLAKRIAEEAVPVENHELEGAAPDQG